MKMDLNPSFDTEDERISKVAEVFGTDWDVELTPSTWGIFTSGHPQPRSGGFTWFDSSRPNMAVRTPHSSGIVELTNFLLFYLPHFEPNPLKIGTDIDSSKVNQDTFTEYREQLNSLINQFHSATSGFNQELLMRARSEQEAIIEFINNSGIFKQRTLQWFGTMEQLRIDYSGPLEWYSKGLESRVRLDFVTAHGLLSDYSYMGLPRDLSNDFFEFIETYTWSESSPLK